MGFNNSQEKLNSSEIYCKQISKRSQMKQHLKTLTETKSFVCGRIASENLKPKESSEKLINFSSSVEKVFEKSGAKDSPKEKPIISKRRSSSKFHLKQHLKTNAPKKFFICEICKRKLSSKRSLFQHMKTHAKEKCKSFICNICDRKLSSKHSLLRHIKTHAEEKHKSFICNICERKYYSTDCLRRHMKIHTEEKPKSFICNICDGKYSSADYLRQHMKLHTKEKHSTCDNCEAVLTSRFDRHQHRKMHAGKKNSSVTFVRKIFHQSLVYNSILNHCINRIL